jgi:hypothetical protein
MGKNKKKPEELGCLGNGYCELQICGEEAANLVWREKRREEKRIELNFFASSSSSSSSSTAASAHTRGNTDDVIAHRRFRTQNAAFVPDHPFFHSSNGRERLPDKNDLIPHRPFLQQNAAFVREHFVVRPTEEKHSRTVGRTDDVVP